MFSRSPVVLAFGSLIELLDLGEQLVVWYVSRSLLHFLERVTPGNVVSPHEMSLVEGTLIFREEQI
jgi:hypothetical protein